MKIVTTGEKQIDKALEAIAAEDGAKSINKAMRQELRRNCRDVVLPEVQARIPEDSGFLRSQLKVRAIKRSRKFIGFSVQFPDPLFTGDTFYAGFLEFGYEHHRAGYQPPDSFLRYAGYGNETTIRDNVKAAMVAFIKEVNRKA